MIACVNLVFPQKIDKSMNEAETAGLQQFKIMEVCTK
jgi:hypothetical protein